MILSNDLSLPGSEIVSEALDDTLSLLCLVIARILKNALFLFMDIIVLIVDSEISFVC